MKRWWRNVRRALRAFRERGRHGWSVEDTWNLDVYLCRVMAGSLQHLADHLHSYPPTFGCELCSELGPDTQEGEAALRAWKASLARWASIFRDYAEGAFDDNARERLNKVQEALIEMAPWWGALWD